MEGGALFLTNHSSLSTLDSQTSRSNTVFRNKPQKRILKKKKTNIAYHTHTVFKRLHTSMKWDVREYQELWNGYAQLKEYVENCDFLTLFKHSS